MRGHRYGADVARSHANRGFRILHEIVFVGISAGPSRLNPRQIARKQTARRADEMPVGTSRALPPVIRIPETLGVVVGACPGNA